MNRTAVLITTAAVALALVVMVWWQTPWGALPRGLQIADPTLDFSAAEIAAAHGFRSTLRWLSLASLLIGLVVLLVIAFTSAGTRWFSIVDRLPGGIAVRTALAVAPLTAMIALVRLPFSIAGERIARREGLSTSTWPSWGMDQLKALLVSTVITGVAVVMLGVLARWQPRQWWVTAASGAAVLTIAMSFLFPILVEPLFNRFTPMDPGPLRTRLLSLADRDGVPVSDVLVADASRRTTALNAYVSGIGATRRIVVYDTLLNSAPASEVEMVVAHELGHAKNRDVWVGTVIGALAAGLAVLLLALVLGGSVAGTSAIPAIVALLTLFTFAQQPLANVVSRQVEARADRHALALTEDAQTFADMQRRLALANRADVIAPRWAYLLFASHPSTRERLALARWWAAREGQPRPGPLAP